MGDSELQNQLNNKKIAFISCIKNRETYIRALTYIKALRVPEGYETVYIAIEHASSMASGYNHAMRGCDAKYKIYFHQDVYIVNPNFLQDIIYVFERDSRLGMIGVVGAKKIPPSGIWWEANEKYGKVCDNHTGSMQPLVFNEVIDDYESVQAIDGLIMVTQYDVPWREDLIQDWHFYDTSQCIEFHKAGYRIGIPKQENPWCLHDCGTDNLHGYFEAREIFLKYYSEFITPLNGPLVSILIPTYNRPGYFELALKSALDQTYKNIEIIVCDDSTNDATENIIKRYLEQYTHIRYVRNETNIGQFLTDLKLFDLAAGEYINYLMDDDLFHPQKIEKMMTYFLNDPSEEVRIVTSHRQVIDEEGKHLPDVLATQRFCDNTSMADGISIGNFLIKYNWNFIGEPTTVLFRKKDLKEPFGVFAGRRYGCSVDLASWLNLLADGKLVYIAETLSYFRLHSGQQQNSPRIIILGTADYAHRILAAPQKGYLQNPGEYKESVERCLYYLTEFMRQEIDYSDCKQEREEIIKFYDEILSLNAKLAHLNRGRKESH